MDALAHALLGARRVLAITGAGLSADSGLPTYRGIGGLYEGGETDEGMPVEAALSGEVFARNPEITWRYLAALGRAGSSARPNAGHRALAAIEADGREVCVLTQNVDGLHRAAGSRWVLEIHGRMDALLCTACSHREAPVDYSALQVPPRCPACGAVLRPPVVLFGEMLPDEAIAELRAALKVGFDLVLSIGTSSLFPYIVEPLRLAAAEGVPTAEINPDQTPVSTLVDYRIPSPAAEVLPEVHRRADAAQRD